MDNRINLTAIENMEFESQKAKERYLLCLYPEDSCEQTVYAEEIGWGHFTIAPYKGLLAVVFSTPAQFLFELFCIFLIKVKHNTEKASENCKILSY